VLNYRNGKVKCEKCLEILKTVHGESTMGRSNVFKWHKRFREGREDVNDDERLAVPVMK
jgi:hypothetical protein